MKMLSRYFRIAGLLAVGGGLAAVAACSSSGSNGNTPPADCHADPSQCPSGQTCWPIDTTPTFQCIPSNPAFGFQASCLDDVGKATCGDGLTCDTLDPMKPGVCTYFCDEPRGHVCPVGYACDATHVGGATGPVIQVCRKASTVPGDASVPEPPPPPGYLPDGGFAMPDGAYDGGPPQQ